MKHLLTPLFSMAAVAPAAAAIVTALPPGDIFDDFRLVGFCVIGSASGAFLAIATFMPKGNATTMIRRTLLKFGASLLSGITFGPAILLHWNAVFAPQGGLPPPSMVLAVSGTVATLFVWALHLALPRLEAKLRKLLPASEEY